MKFVPTFRKAKSALGLLSGALWLFIAQAHAASIESGFFVKVGLLPAGSSGGGGVGPPSPPPPTPPGPPTPPVGGVPDPGNPGFCRNTTTPGAFGATVTVVCATGAFVDLTPGRGVPPFSPMHGGALRYVTQAYWNGEWIDSMDNPPGTGTITSWRLVRLSDRNFLELTVGW